MAKKKMNRKDKLELLRNAMGEAPFGYGGQLWDASEATAPIIKAWETADMEALPKRMSTTFRKQAQASVEQLQDTGLRRVVRVTDPHFLSGTKSGLGFEYWTDASREWRECIIQATVLEQYLDKNTGQCVMENFDEEAVFTIRQSRHIRASDRKKKRKDDYYDQEEHFCPSCGAAVEQTSNVTTCPYCGAQIRFHFFDWQLESFYLDIQKSSMMKSAKAVSKNGLYAALELLLAILNLIEGDPLTVLAGTVFFLVIAFFFAPPWLQITLLGLLLVLIAKSLFKSWRKAIQKKRKAGIVRYSDGYLRSCIYDEIWKTIDASQLIGFSLGDIILSSVEHTEKTTMVEINTTVIRKFLTDERDVRVETENCSMKLQRARYPERIKAKGAIMTEKACPSCDANFQPDENGCCAYCGYSLKLENYVWRRCD